MSKAEEAALKVFPQKIEGDSRGSYDLNELNRQKFLLGYHQAEKDLELTWEDISVLRKIMAEYSRQASNEMLVLNDEDYCKEVLNCFKAQKGEKV